MSEWLRLSLRLTGFALHLLAGLVLCLTVFPRNASKMRRFQQRIVQWWLRLCLRILGVNVQVRGQKQELNGPVCLVANHVSWIDILIMGSLFPARLLSKTEVKKWFIVGYLANKTGTLFIKRGGGARNAILEMRNCLARGESVGFFPEGSTGVDSAVRKFYPPLFSAAAATKAAILPLAIAYPSEGKLHPSICFPKGESFLHNACKVMRAPRIKVIVDLLQPVAGANHKQMAMWAQDAVSRKVAYSYAQEI